MQTIYRLPSRDSTGPANRFCSGSLRIASLNAAAPSVSLCMIMRDEENVLYRCLSFATKIFDEIIIVDTGSTDRSLEIAAKFPCRVFHRPWDDDFSAPRNLSIDQATSDWIMILDPDEYIDPKDYLAFRHLTRQWTINAYVFQTRNYTLNPQMIRFTPNDKAYPLTAHFPGYCVSLKTRLFQRRLNYRFESCFHELLDPSIVRSGRIPTMASIPVQHWCHDAPNRTHAERSTLYLRLGRKKVAQEPQSGQAWAEYGTALAIAGYGRQAYKCFIRAASLGFGDEPFFLSLFKTSLELGLGSSAGIWLEKALCARHPNLTHSHFLYKKAVPV